MAIQVPTITLYSGQVPSRTQAPATFSANVDSWLTYQITQIADTNTLATYLNTTFNDTVDQTNTLAQSVQDLNNSLISTVNFKGAWSSLSGVLNKPATVFHNGNYWQLLANLPNVAASEPSLVSNDWAVAAQASGRAKVITPFTLEVVGRYFIQGNGTITLPDASTVPDGTVFDFVAEIGSAPSVTGGAGSIQSIFGVYDSIIIDTKGIELIANAGKWEV